jgi:hypothetical protein
VCTLYRYEIHLLTYFIRASTKRNMLKCNGDGSLSSKPSNSVCIIIVLLLLWIWMTVKLEAIQQTPAFRPSQIKRKNLAWLEKQWHLAEADKFIIKADDRPFFYPPVFFYYSTSRLRFISISFCSSPLKTEMVSRDELNWRDGNPEWSQVCYEEAWVRCKFYANYA